MLLLIDVYVKEILDTFEDSGFFICRWGGGGGGGIRNSVSQITMHSACLNDLDSLSRSCDLVLNESQQHLLLLLKKMC